MAIDTRARATVGLRDLVVPPAMPVEDTLRDQMLAAVPSLRAFGIFLTPVFYVLLRALTGNRPLKHHGEAPALASRGVSLKPQPMKDIE